jgi:short-subunit dehydrogenase
VEKSILIVGAGSGLSLAVARMFGKHGFKVGLISRNKGHLENLSLALSNEDIENYYEVADVSNSDELHIAINSLEHYLNGVDVLFYNVGNVKQKSILEETQKSLTDDFLINVVGLQQSYNYLRNTLRDRSGAVLVSGGGFAMYPHEDYGSLSIGKAAIRNLAAQLHKIGKTEDIYVGILNIAGHITSDSTSHTPEKVAVEFWKLYSEKLVAELKY